MCFNALKHKINIFSKIAEKYIINKHKNTIYSAPDFVTTFNNEYYKSIYKI